MTTLNRLFDAYDATEQLVQTSTYLHNDFADISKIFADKRQNPTICIMVYGVYNAGKSTLINALLGKEIADVGDVPLTAQVHRYAYNGFEILDTPGIDAPIAHELITNEQLLKSDAIIFVVNPRGVAEEQKTLDALMGLVKAGKKVFLVFNCKDQLSDDDFTRLKQETFERLQTLAQQHGVQNSLSKIPLLKINAKTALKAKLDNKEALLNHSGFVEFERELTNFLNSIDNSDVEQRLTAELTAFLDKLSLVFQEKTDDSLVKKYQALIKEVHDEKQQIKTQLTLLVDTQKQELYQQIKTALHADNPDVQTLINNSIEAKTAFISDKLNDLLENARLSIDHDIQQMQIALSYTPIDIAIHPQELDTQSITTDTTNHANTNTVNILGGLHALKEALPQIGIASIQNFATRAIPFLMAAVTLYSAFFDSKDEEYERHKREAEQAERLRELKHKHIESVAHDTSEQFYTLLLSSINKNSNAFFDTVFHHLNGLQQRFDEEVQKHNDWLATTLRIKNSLK